MLGQVAIDLCLKGMAPTCLGKAGQCYALIKVKAGKIFLGPVFSFEFPCALDATMYLLHFRRMDRTKAILRIATIFEPVQKGYGSTTKRYIHSDLLRSDIRLGRLWASRCHLVALLC